MGPLYLGKMGTFVNFRYINNLAQGTPQPDQARAQAVLYVHGVKGNRSRGYRVGLYNVLLKLGLKVDIIQSF